MNSRLAMAAAMALGLIGAASAGMQGQGTKPDAQKPEYKEATPGDTTGREKAPVADQELASPGEDRVSTRAFQTLDKDKDGYLQEGEGEISKDMAAQMDEVDTNEDGKVSESEFSAFESVRGATESASDRSPED
jgi:hypothetical protein